MDEQTKNQIKDWLRVMRTDMQHLTELIEPKARKYRHGDIFQVRSPGELRMFVCDKGVIGLMYVTSFQYTTGKILTFLSYEKFEEYLRDHKNYSYLGHASSVGGKKVEDIGGK